MLSYVIPATQETPASNGAASRNLSLNLNPQSQQYGSQLNTQTTNVAATVVVAANRANNKKVYSDGKDDDDFDDGVDCNESQNYNLNKKEKAEKVAATKLTLNAMDTILANANDDGTANDVGSKNTSESCNERTRLLDDGHKTMTTMTSTVTQSMKSRQQNNGNNNNNNINNINGNTNNNTNTNNNNGQAINGGRIGAAIVIAGGGDNLTTTNIGQTEEALSEDASDISDDKQIPRQITKKPKLTKLGTKSVGLKRVSFGSSKGSMVETLVFETPTPLSEHVEPSFGFDSDYAYKTRTPTPTTVSALPIATNFSLYNPKVNIDDSGIEVQEESERSIVRVSIYQSSQPQQILHPDIASRYEDSLDNPFSNCNFKLEDMMTTTSTIPGYDRQQSTDSGWDNPFRPGGDLSREADEIVNMIRGGKPITPTEDHSLVNGNAQRGENGTIVETVTKGNVTQNQSAQNGTNKVQATANAAGNTTITTAGGKTTENNGVTSLAQVSKQVVPGPTSASHVVIDEKKNKKKGCCTIQ